MEWGLVSIKVDGCGAEKNVSKYAELLNATGTPVLLENWHNGSPKRDASGKGDCPMHLFRTSKDIRPTFGSILGNLGTVDKFNSQGLTGPGCW